MSKHNWLPIRNAKRLYVCPICKRTWHFGGPWRDEELRKAWGDRPPIKRICSAHTFKEIENYQERQTVELNPGLCSSCQQNLEDGIFEPCEVHKGKKYGNP